ncbi:MAG: hypothetical protein GDA46_00900 [Bdellovibrionales bacterium]|nr:hypothetical protein [Bdellovibrionales bacterium]
MRYFSIFQSKEIQPFKSLLIILVTFFIIALLQITLRRLSYSLYQFNKTFDEVQDEYYSSLRTYRKMTQTQRLDQIAQKHFLDQKKEGQIIQVIDGRAVVID